MSPHALPIRCAGALAWICTLVSIVLSIESLMVGKVNNLSIIQFDGTNIPSALGAALKSRWGNDTEFDSHKVTPIWAPAAITTVTYSTSCNGSTSNNLDCTSPASQDSFLFYDSVLRTQLNAVTAARGSNRTNILLGDVGTTGMHFIGQKGIEDVASEFQTQDGETSNGTKLTAEQIAASELNYKAFHVALQFDEGTEILNWLGRGFSIGKGFQGGIAGTVFEGVALLGLSSLLYWPEGHILWDQILGVFQLIGIGLLAFSATAITRAANKLGKEADPFGGQAPGGVFTITINQTFLVITWTALAMAFVAHVAVGTLIGLKRFYNNQVSKSLEENYKLQSASSTAEQPAR